MQLFSSLIVLCFASLAATRRTHYVTEYDIRTVYTDNDNIYTPQVVTIIVTHTRDHTTYCSRTTTLVDPASVAVENGTTKIKSTDSEVPVKEVNKAGTTASSSSCETVNKAITTTASSEVNTETKPQVSKNLPAEGEANTKLNSNSAATSGANTDARNGDGDVSEDTNVSELTSSSTKVSLEQVNQTNGNSIDASEEPKASTLRNDAASDTPTTSSSTDLSSSSVSTTTSSSSTSVPTSSVWPDDIYAEIQDSPGIDVEFSREALDVTNQYRVIHHSPPVRWNKTAYEYAQSYADKYDCSLNLGHSGTQDFSENLGVNYNGSKAVIDRWYAEEAEYDYTTHDQYSHFTALVWKSSTQMGCAYKDCSVQNHQKYIICNYSPTGNVVGYLQDNVFPP